MENHNKYEACLMKESENTPSDFGEFDTFDDALEWSLGRFEHYDVAIVHRNLLWVFSVDNNIITYFDGNDFTTVDKSDIFLKCGTIIDPDYTEPAE